MRAAPLLAALLLLLLSVSTAGAAPVELTVRIEGATRTLFEGPILSDGHDVRAASDAAARHCDGTNGGAHPTPGPTATAAAVDAMELIGRDFDGRWYPGFDDYLVERWGPDGQDPEASAFWGLLVNGALTPVGGCQWAAAPGDEVLWAYDAFTGRSPLRLAAAGDSRQAPEPPAPTAAVEVGQPLELLVQSYSGGEGEEPEVEPAAGVTIAPVATEPGSGFQTAQVESPEAVATAADGTAEVSFASPGWRRLKAEEESGFARSNRLDVCVEPVGGGSCGPLPADARLRVPARYLVGPGPLGSQPERGEGGGRTEPRLQLGRVKLNRRTGTATVAAAVSGAGRVRLDGRGIRPFRTIALAAGNVVLRVRPAAGGRSELRRTGRLRTTLRVALLGESPAASARRALVLRLRRPAR